MTEKSKVSWNRGKGAAYKWLCDHVAHQGDACLSWPFSRHPRGYGMFGYLGCHYWAHRFMCELAHGAPPTSEHQAGHSCARGHEGCVNPRHLSWQTFTENMREKVRQGNAWAGRGASRFKLTETQVAEIRAAVGEKVAVLAGRFGVSESNIRQIRKGDTWRTGKRPGHPSLDENKIREIRALRESGMTHQAIADRFGLHPSTVHGIASGRRWAHVSREQAR